MTKPSLQHEIIKINIKSNGIRYIYADDEQHVDAGLEGGRVLSGLKLLQHHGHGISTWTTIRGNTPRFPGVACGWAAERARARHARTHARAHTRAQSGRALTRRRGHTRARGTRTRNPRCTTPIEETSVWLRWKIRWFRPKFREKTSLFKLSFQNQTKINFILFSERLLFLFPARII